MTQVMVFTSANSDVVSMMVPLSRVITYLPPGASRRLAPPPSLAATFPYTGVGWMVRVMVGVCVGGRVISRVSGTAVEELSVSAAVVIVAVLVLETITGVGVGFCVEVAGRPEVEVGGALGSAARGGVTASGLKGEPDPIK